MSSKRIRLDQATILTESIILGPYYGQLSEKELRKLQHRQVPMQLYNYQLRALWWMITREKNPQSLLNDQFELKSSLLDECLEELAKCRGGMLCDETLMVSSLIVNHPRVDWQVSDSKLLAGGGTLIVVPDTIANQWFTELQKGAPSLSYYFYYGGKTTTAEQLLLLDVVLTTYSILAKDYYIISAENRYALRRQPVYEKRKCPLIQIEWWRIILDEAQMVENTFSHPAMITQNLARVNSWTVTGTPWPKTGTLVDMQGLFKFLHVPFATADFAYSSSNALTEFLSIIMHRNTKKNVENEMKLPPQSDQTIFLHFKPIENQYYRDLLEEAKKDIGPPIEYEDDVNTRRDYEKRRSERLAKMNSWLLRLRQTCCHPKVANNAGRLAGMISRMETIDDILYSMLYRSESTIFTEERNIVLHRIVKCHILERGSKFEQAIDIYKKEIEFVEKRIDEMNAKLETLENASNEDELNGELVAMWKVRVKLWVELKHRLLFFLASAYYNWGNRENAEPGSEIRQNEEKYYDAADKIRQEMLEEFEEDAKHALEDLVNLYQDHQVKLGKQNPEAFDLYGGIITGEIFEEVKNLQELLNEQWDTINQWRDELVKLLSVSLQNFNDEGEMDGNEFERGVVVQEKATAYIDVLFKLVMNFRTALNGTNTNFPVELNESEVHDGLMEIFERIKVKRDQKCLKEYIQDLKRVQQDLLVPIPEEEIALAKMGIQIISKNVELQLKQMALVESEFHHFRTVFNERVKYFSHLNKISDGVESTVLRGNLEDLDHSMNQKIGEAQSTIARELGRKRYFEYLSDPKNSSSQQKECGSCLSEFESGSLTECGHWFCKDCTKTWLSKRKSCPVCSARVDPATLPAVTLKSNPQVNRDANDNSEFLKLLENFSSKGSFGTKIDTIVRHILMILSKAPSEKILIFSQWNSVLSIISEALIANEIGHVSLENMGYDPQSRRRLKKEARGKTVAKFNENPFLTCFMLNAKSQSSGLTLVAATHVFLIEPLVNKGIEQQSVNRVHRIGQERNTFVWRYIMRDTVESLLLNEADTSALHTKVRAKDAGESLKEEVLERIFDQI